MTTVYVVQSIYSAFSDNVGMVVLGGWHLDIQPDSAIAGVIQRIDAPLASFSSIAMVAFSR